ncbi:MAG: Endonuclease YhcR [Gemmatimonadaceae bacterium]|nr:Endonuclease YhcR [Gemmatimonadaceae bacterium]
MSGRGRPVVVALAVLAACARPVSVDTGPPPETPAFRVLSINDVYVADTLRDGSGGVARVAALRDSLARTAPVLFMLAGDVLAPSLLTKWYGGAQMVDVLNAARLDFAALGNHEFDISQARFEARLRESRFRWLSANCRRADATPFPNVRGWDTVRTGGVLVGVVGATIASRYPSWVSCTDPVAAVHAAIDTAEASGATAIVALTHLAVSADSALLVREPRIAFIAGGHEHTEQRVAIGDRLVRKADSDARTAVVASFYRRGSGWRVQDELVPIDRRLSDAAPVAAVVARWTDSLIAHLGPVRVLGTSASAIDVRDGSGRNGESPFGNLATDAMRAGTRSDVALLNGGAMRLDDVIAAGPITNHQMESIFLFPDETRVVTFPLTGAALRAQLTHNVKTQIGVGGYLQVSGIRYTYDGGAPPSQRSVLALTREDGRPIADSDTLVVSAVGYMACNGGDGYTMVEQSRSACARLSSAPRTVDLLMAYLAAMPGGQIAMPPTGRVSTGGVR